MSEVHYDDEFLRDETTIDRDFTIVANRWITDKRIVGNPLSIYLWIRAQAPGFKVGRGVIMRALELGKGAFNTAIAKLEESGYLERIVDRWPAGAKTSDGRQLGGASRVRFRVLDPTAAPATVSATPDQVSPTKAQHGTESDVEPHECNDAQPGAENQTRVIHRPKPGAENQTRVIHRQEIIEVENVAKSLQPGSENPTSGFPPLNKTKDKQNKSSSSGSNQTTARPGVTPDDDDSPSSIETQSSPSRNAFGVDEHELRAGLIAAFGPERVTGVDLTNLSVTVLSRSSQRRVAHPTRFVLAAVMNAPEELLASSLEPSTSGPRPAHEVQPAAALPGDLQGAVERLCATTGHQWFRLDGGAVCHRCGLNSHAIPASVRESCEERTAGTHNLGGQQVCRTCGHDDLSDFHASTRKAG